MSPGVFVAIRATTGWSANCPALDEHLTAFSVERCVLETAEQTR